MITLQSSKSVFPQLADGWLGSAVKLLARPFGRVATALRNRREIAALLQAESGVLKDLGLLPSDVSSALAEPLWRDPSLTLLASSLERRSGNRAAAHDNLFCLGRPSSAQG